MAISSVTSGANVATQAQASLSNRANKQEAEVTKTLIQSATQPASEPDKGARINVKA